MNTDDRVLDVLARREALRELGQAPTAHELCADCPELVTLVERKIEELDQLDRLLSPTDQVPLPRTVSPPAPEWSARGERTFRAVRFHDRGGQGEVFEAVDVELGRPVALKRLQRQFDHDPRVHRRFLHEAKITGLLEHPGVAPVYGLAHDDRGKPCYAMRFVQGETLKEAVARFHEVPPWKDSFQGVAFRELLGRFVAVCNTMAYAHSRGIIHRDLKPQNIVLGRFGETVVLDWGLAKQMGGADTAEGESHAPPGDAGPADQSAPGEAKGTWAYMSPEQANGRGDEVGPASDIFALGATLYAVLVGRPPYAGTDAFDLARHHRFSPPREHNRTVPGALDAVCRRAMAREPGERYADALELSRDVERWLADEPVSAWQEPRAERARRWFGRHRTLVVSTAAVALVGAVLLGVIDLLMQSKYLELQDAKSETETQKTAAEKERNKAQDAEAVARSTNGFLVGLFRSSDPFGLHDTGFRMPVERPSQLTALELVERGAASIRARSAGPGAVRAAVLDTLGDVYRGLGRYDRAQEFLTEAMNLRRQHLGEDHPDTAESYFHLAWLYQDGGKYQKAEEFYRKCLTIRQDLAQPDPLLIADTSFHLAWLLAHQLPETRPSPERLAEADALFRETLRTRTKMLGEDAPAVAYAEIALAVLLAGRGGRDQEVLEHLTRGVQVLGKQEGGNPVAQAVVNFFAAQQHWSRREYREAIALHEAVLAQARRHVGDAHPITAMLKGNLAGLLRQIRDLPKAERYIREALAVGRYSALRWHPMMITGLNELADYVKARDPLEAEGLYEEALEYAENQGKDSALYQQTKAKLEELRKKRARDEEKPPGPSR